MEDNETTAGGYNKFLIKERIKNYEVQRIYVDKKCKQSV